MALFSLSSLDLGLFCFLLLVCLFFLFLIKSSSLLFLLIIMETSWITLYLTALISALLYDYTMCLSLGFFFLMFSAAEISIGLSLFLLISDRLKVITYAAKRTPYLSRT